MSSNLCLPSVLILALIAAAASAFAPTFFSSRNVLASPSAPAGNAYSLLVGRSFSAPPVLRGPAPVLFVTSDSSSSPLPAEPQGQQTPTETDHPQSEQQATTDPAIVDATQTLSTYDAAQQSFMSTDGMRGMGGGTSALSYLQTQLTPADRTTMRDAVRTLISRAHAERSSDSAAGRVMLGICAENAPEALGGLKSWVSALNLPRGMLHGMDVDGVPIPPEELGSVYVKFSTGGAMTFKEMRRSGLGFDALWRPGDALLEPYDGDFRGVYLNVELEDGVFRQFGVLPTDLFMEEEEW